MSLEALFAMNDDAFEGGGREGVARQHAAALHYAMARYACRWLEKQSELWPFYHAWRDAHVRDRTGEKTFAAIVGRTPAQASPEWLTWVRGL